MLHGITRGSRQLAAYLIALLGLLGLASPAAAEVPKAHAEPFHYSGSWWFGPEHNGEGLAVQVLEEDRALFYWFTTTPDGDQAWLVGDGSIEGNRFIFEQVWRPVGARFGEAFEPDDVEFQDWGSLTITFESCSQGTLAYESINWGSEERTLKRLNGVAGVACAPGKATAAKSSKAQSNAGGDAGSTQSTKSFSENISGAWWDPAHDGEGFIVQMPTASNGNSQRAAIYWFTYDPDGNQAWVAAEARVNGRTLEVPEETAIMASGAAFGEDFDTEDVDFDNWGDFEIAFGEGEDAAATLSYEAGEELSRFGSGQQELTRFVPPAGMGAITRPVRYEEAEPIETLDPLGTSPQGLAYSFDGPVTADFNQDGLTDVIGHFFPGGLEEETEPAPLKILLNQGDGTVTDGNEEFFPEGAPKYQSVHRFVIEDFNGDGCLDIFLGNSGKEFRRPLPGEANGLLLSNPNCTLREVSRTHLPHQVADFTHGSTAADIDNDGDIDLYVNNLGSESGMVSYLMKNDGTGRFQIIAGGQQGDDASHPYFGAGWSQFVDANGDEYPDLLLVNGTVEGNQENVLLINSGEPPYFSKENRVPLPTASPCGDSAPVQDENTGDVNGDGLTDIMLFTTPECQSQYVQILINQKDSPQFLDKTDELMPAQENESAMLGFYTWLRDLDGNGLVDISVYRLGREEFNLLSFHYLQDGSGHFQQLPQPGEDNLSNTHVTHLDINGDRVLDRVGSKCVEFEETEDGFVCRESRFFSAESTLP